MSIPEVKTGWDLSPLFAGDDDAKFGSERERAQAAVADFVRRWKASGSYLANASSLRQALGEYEGLLRDFGVNTREAYYFWLKSELNENDRGVRARLAKAQDFEISLQNELQFFPLSISKIPPERQSRLLDDAGLSPYRHYLERLFAQGAHTLSDPEERILNLTGTGSYDHWVKMVSSALAAESAEVVAGSASKTRSFSELTTLVSDPSKGTRDAAGAALDAILKKHERSAEAELNAVLERRKVEDQLRHFKRPDQSRHLNDDISPEVVDSLLAAVSSRFDLSARYYALKAKLLDQERLGYHERNAPWGTPDTTKAFPEGVEIVRAVFARLDPAFREVLDRFLADGQVDAFPRTGKHSGAFCAHNGVSDPVYVLLNYEGRTRDLTTLAHEFGHAIHNELSRARQTPLNFGAPVSTAEVASTFFEDFVFEELARSAGPKERLSLLLDKVGDDVSTIFRQVACYRFEQELHERYRSEGYLSAETIGEIFGRHMASYLGPAVEMKPGHRAWWVYWSHIRTYFYVYSYASGLLVSKRLQAMVRKEGSAVALVKEFLSSGTSEAPADLFSRLGLNIQSPAFWNEGLAEVEQNLTDCEHLASELTGH